MTALRSWVGERYGRLIVIKILPPRKVRCVCDCGKECDVERSHLRSGSMRSCGCLTRELRTKHGMSHTKVYYVWHAMLQRCENPNSKNWKNYGARGISVCLQWHDFSQFFSDMGPRPPRGTLERIEVNGNYEPSNCVWASYRAQARNKRNNVWVSVDGVPMVLNDAVNVENLVGPRLYEIARRRGVNVTRIFREAIAARHHPNPQTTNVPLFQAAIDA